MDAALRAQGGGTGREAGSPDLSSPQPHLRGLLSANLFPSLREWSLTGRGQGEGVLAPSALSVTPGRPSHSPGRRRHPFPGSCPFQAPSPLRSADTLGTSSFSDGESQACRGEGVCPRSRSWHAAELGTEPTESGSASRGAQTPRCTGGGPGDSGQVRGDSLPSSGCSARQWPHGGVSGVPRSPRTPALPKGRTDSPSQFPGPLPSPQLSAFVDYDLGRLDSGRAEDTGEKIKGITSFVNKCF